MTELRIAATVENIDVVTDFVNEQLEALAGPVFDISYDGLTVQI